MSLSSADKQEIEKFSAQNHDWWNPSGVWKPLHRLNPARVSYVLHTIEGLGRKKGLSLLDIGCGGGLMCEPLACAGFAVTGVDASKEALEAAKHHAASEKLKIPYIEGCVEDLLGKKKRYDVVLALEILEHLADRRTFLKAVAGLLKPKGVLIVSTVNRTVKSYLLGIVLAEYALRWVPDGMHDWNKFVRPSELAKDLEQAGFALSDLTGVVYNPLSDDFDLSADKLDVNYMATAFMDS